MGNSLRLGVCGLLVVLISVAVASAAPLNLVLDDPDISSFFVQVDYVDGQFTAAGTPSSLDLDISTIGPDYTINEGGTFALTALIDSSGNASAGTLQIDGVIPGFATSGTLLTGSLLSFGYPDAGGEVFEFVFEVNGGDLASLYGSTAAVILDAGSTFFDGTFTGEFHNFYDGVADTAPLVPEPAALTLLVGVGSSLMLRRRSSRA